MESVKRNQKTIGIIGGVSWESTALYYKLINESVRDYLGGISSAKLFMSSLNYEPIVALERQGKWDQVGEILAATAKTLEDAGADFIILCCNTLHKVTSYIEACISVPFLHIADAAGKVAVEKGIQKIGLLGTQFTVEDGFYASRLKNKFRLDVVIPTQSDRKLIDDIIYNELCQGKVLFSSKADVIRIMQLLQKDGAEAILLGCT
ncbi:MAG: amino acid racemase [Rhabdochlamydiaceae bacterium]|nr:amino acid racemase [Rhabdochlamydiaceae bacterium]